MDSISYKEAAKEFETAFPVGNGRIGATVYGGVDSQVITLNEESLWSSPFIDRVNRSSWKDYKKIKELYAAGAAGEAGERMKESMASVPAYPAHYRSAGNFRIDFFSSAERSPLAEKPGSLLVYERRLDLETGIASENFSIESAKDSTAFFSRSAGSAGGSNVSYSREVFSSALDDVIAIHIGASLPRNIYLRAGFEGDGQTRSVFALDDDTVVLERTDGIPMSAMAMACCTGGSCCVKGGSLIVEAADDVTIYIDVETAYRSGHYRRRGGNVSRPGKSLATSCSDKALKKLCFAQVKPYQSVLDDHASRFSRRYRRLSLRLSDGEAEARWKYGRYLLLSSCGGKASLPPLQTGLWIRPEGQPSDGGGQARYVLGSLAEMPYCEYGLEKSYAALGCFIKAFRKRSRKCAREMFQADGSLAYGSCDLWGDGALSADDERPLVPLGAAYAALSLKKYYDYTLDRKFLKKHLRLLTAPCEFFAVFEGPDSYSDGEQALIRRLFEAARDATRLLGVSEKHPEIHAYLEKHGSPVTEGGVLPLPSRRAEGGCGLSDGISLVDAIMKARLDKGKVEISLLSGLEHSVSGGAFPVSGGVFPVSGELKGLHLPGNLRAEVLWEDGSPKGGRIYAKPGCVEYAKDIVLLYGGRAYPASLQTGSIDILNILPTTVFD